MALFGSDRDMSLFRSINRELINRYIDIEVGLYKLALPDTDINIYGESDRKTYYQPVRMNALIARDATTAQDEGYGMDKNRTALFAFFKPDLIEKNLIIEIGDIIYWDLEYYEVDNEAMSQEHIAGRSELTDPGVPDRGIFGMDISVIIEAHVTRTNGLNIIETRSGTSVVSSKPRNL
jgi:hypothetical protein